MNGSDQMSKGIITGRNETRRKQLNHLEVKCMRILEGWTDEERKELEEAKNNNFSSAIDLIHGIGDDDIDCHALYEKYYREDTNDSNQMAKDIVDFYCGNAKFPEQKYYIKMPKVRYSYLFKDVDGTLDWGNDFGVLARKYFTEQEIKAIDPRYMAFAVPVEDDDE